MRDASLLPPARPHADVPGAATRRWLPIAIQFVGGAAVGAAFAFLGLRHLEAWFETLPWPWWVFALLAIPMVWVHVLVHEAGHALAGAARGMHAIALGVGPVRIEKGTGGWHWRWGGGLAGISGFAALFPDPSRGLRRADQAWYLFGGPLANLGTAAVALAAASRVDGAAHGVLLVFAVAGVFLGLVNLVPFRSSGWRSDGLGLRELATGAPEAAPQMQAHQLVALSMAGVRPRDWPEAFVPSPPPADDHSLLATNAVLLRTQWALDRRDHEAAEAGARDAVSRYWSTPEALRPYIALVLADYAVLVARDPDLLRAWRPLCEGGLLDLTAQRAWLDAELAASAGDAGLAGSQVAAARAALGKVHDRATARLLAEQLDALEARL